MRLIEAVKALDKDNEMIQIEVGFLYVVDRKTLKLKRAWKQKEADEYESINLQEIVNRIATKLKDSVDSNALLQEVLITRTHPAFLIDLDERLKQPTVKVESKPKHCYSLSISGKRGRPVELTLVHNQGFDT